MDDEFFNEDERKSSLRFVGGGYGDAIGGDNIAEDVQINAEQLGAELDQIGEELIELAETQEGGSALFNFVQTAAEVFSRYRVSGGAAGWSANCILPDGSKWSEDETARLEAEFVQFGSALPDFLQPESATAATELDLESQTGGAGLLKVPSSIELGDISVDSLFAKINDYIAGINSYFQDFSRKAGVLKLENTIEASTGDIIIPGTPLQINPHAPAPLIAGILEISRLMIALSPSDFPFLRKIVSLIAGLLDVARGEWKNGIFSFLGMFSQARLMTGIMFKFVSNLLGFISPQIFDEWKYSTFAMTKSFLVGIMIWVFGTFAPKLLRAGVGSQMEKIKELIEQFNAQIDEIESQTTAKGIGADQGYEIKFRRIPTDRMPDFGNIQALQAMFQVPEVFCSKEVREAVKSFESNPLIRFALELMNIPTTDAEFARRCIGVSQNVDEAVVARLMPIVIAQSGPAQAEHMRAELADREERLEVLQKFADAAKEKIESGSISKEEDPIQSEQSLNVQEEKVAFKPTSTRMRGGTRSNRLRLSTRRSRRRTLRLNRNTN